MSTLIDYDEILETVHELVQGSGRLVTFQKASSTPPDGSKPWRGPVAPLSPPALSEALYAVAVPPTSLDALGLRTISDDLVKRCREILIVEPGTNDLSSFTHVVDEGRTYSFEFVEKLRPADTTLLFYVGVAR